MLSDWKLSLGSTSYEFEAKSPGVIQLLMKLNFLSDFVNEETGNFQADLNIKIFSVLNYGMKNYDPLLNDS